jgi:hypothetical protein
MPSSIATMKARKVRRTSSWSSILVLWAAVATPNVEAVRRSSSGTAQRRRRASSYGGLRKMLSESDLEESDIDQPRKAFYKFPMHGEDGQQQQQQQQQDDDILDTLVLESQGSLPQPPVPRPTMPPPPTNRPITVTSEPTTKPVVPATARPTTRRPVVVPTPEPTRGSIDTGSPTPQVTCTVSVQIECQTATDGIPCNQLSKKASAATGSDPCAVDIVQTYTVTNGGTNAIDIVMLDRSYNGEMTNLLPFLEDKTLGSKAMTAVKGTTTINVCESQVITLGIAAGGTPSDGGASAEPCDAKQQYTFEIEGRIDTAQPTSQPTRIDTAPPSSRPTKKPVAPPPPVEPCVLETSVMCLTSDGRPCNELTYPTEPGSCDTATNSTAGGQQEPIQLVYTVTNTGTKDDLEISAAQATFNDIQADVLPFLPETTVGPGRSVTTSQTVSVNLCEGKEYELTFSVEADAVGGGAGNSSCESADKVTFQISGPPPSPALLPQPTESSKAPSPMPVEQREKPTLSPEEVCQLVVNLTCVPPPGIDSCESIPPAEQQCEGRPERIEMLYTGGKCNQSATSQLSRPDWFSCVDVGKGPPKKEGTASFIVVTAKNDPTIVYHRGYVAVGDTYELYDGGHLFVADQNITIYSSDEVGPDTMLQTLVYHSSCTQNVFMNDQFGASKLIGWQNDRQGAVSSTATFSFVLTVSVGTTAASPVTLEKLSSTLTYGPTMDIDFLETYNLTDQVEGFDLLQGHTLTATFDATLDITQRGMYGVLTTVAGEGKDGFDCADLNFYAMYVEDQLPPVSPTQAPTITAGPTPDPETAPCIVAADIRCVVLKTNQPCQELAPPTASRCSGGETPQELRFMYRSGPCSQSNTTATGFNCTDLPQNANSSQLSAVVRVSDPEDSRLLFEGDVRRGEIFFVGSDRNPLSDTIQVGLFADGEATEPFQVLRIPTQCDDASDVSLLTNYGSLQLTAFENDAQGYQSAIDVIDQSFVIRNDGRLVTYVQWANATSTLYGENVLVSPDPGLAIAPGLEYPFSFDSTRINLYVSSGSTYSSTLSVVASNRASGIICLASSNLDFTIR